jgi:hypothetical protein
MVQSQSDFDEAERLSDRRARALPALAIIFLAQQATFLVEGPPLEAARVVDILKLWTWVVLSLALLAALWSNGFWFRRKAIRALLDDEVTRAHRADAMSLGFALAILVAIALYVASMFDTVPVRRALHLIVTAGIGTAVMRFGFLERRAHRVE